MDYIIYIPEADGNREVAEDKQISAEILSLTVREQRRVAGSVTAKRIKGGAFKTNQADLSLKQLDSHVRNICNLTWRGKAVTTIEDLLDTPYVELADEFEAAMQSASILDEGNVKNLRSQSLGDSKKISLPSTVEIADQIDNG